MRSLLVAGILVLAACAESEPLRGIDLPPASLPEEIDAAQWAIAFSHPFVTAFWGEGPHVYRMTLDCPGAVDEPVETELTFFGGDTESPVHDGEIYLRASGLSKTTLGPTSVRFIHPDQDTTAVLTVIGLSEAEVASAAGCEGEIEFDDGRSEPMRPGEPFRP